MAKYPISAFQRSLAAAIFLFIGAWPLLAQDDPSIIKKRKQEHRPNPSYLDNGTLKIGVDLALGGAITYLSRSGSDDNLVNSWDWGRQIQMSHYSGPAPFRVEGKTVARAWEKFPWNPVQAGDHFGFASTLLDSSNNGKEIYVKGRPMQWSLENAPSDCTFETWIKLEGATARVRCRITASRADKSPYDALPQEMPALYLNGPYDRLFSYTGDQPFTKAPLSRVEKAKSEPGGFPWARFLATENWAALVNGDDWGVGVYQPGCVSFLGGFAGTPGKGGPADFPTGYIAPVSREIIDHNIAFDYSYVLIVGKLDAIRQTANALAGAPKSPAWSFRQNRQGWRYENAIDTGWPIKENLEIILDKPDVHLVGPECCWQATQAATLKINLACPPNVKQLKIFWATHDDRRFSEDKSTIIPVIGDKEFHVVEVKLSESPKYRGAITQMRIDPLGARNKERLRVKDIGFR